MFGSSLSQADGAVEDRFRALWTRGGFREGIRQVFHVEGDYKSRIGKLVFASYTTLLGAMKA